MPGVSLGAGWGRALGVLLLCLTLAAAAYPAVSAAQPAQGVGPYDEWLREHRVTAEARLVLAYDGRLLRYRKVLEGPELRDKLGVERLVGDEAAVEVAEEELSDLVTSLGLSEGEASRLKSGGTVEVLSVPYAGACTVESDPPTWWDQYPYPKYSWERFRDYVGDYYYYCTADPINLVWYRQDGYGFTDLSPIQTQLVYDNWTYPVLENTNYVYDPTYGWEPDQKALQKDYPTSDYDRYHVRLWKVHKWGYGRVDVVGQAHVDTPWWQGGHEAVLFEEAEAEVSKAFRYPTYGYWNWYVEGEVVPLYNSDEGGDGWATRVKYKG